MPYGIGADKTQNKKKGEYGHKLYKDTNWDDSPPNEVYFKELFRVSKNQVIWGGNYFVNHLDSTMGWIIWDKVQRIDMSDCELAYSSFNRATRVFTYARGKNQGFMNKGRFHPTSKPIELYEWLLKHYAKPNDKILDTHLGSGSIAIACDKMGFELTACEIDEDYFNGAVKRLKTHQDQFTMKFEAV